MQFFRSSFARSFFVSFVTSFFRACDRLNVRVYVRVYVAFVGLFMRSFVLSFVCSFVRAFVRLVVRSCIRACVRPSFVCQLDTWLLLFLSFVPFRFVHRRVLFLFSSEVSAKLFHCISTANCDDNKRHFVTSQISTSGPRAL